MIGNPEIDPTYGPAPLVPPGMTWEQFVTALEDRIEKAEREMMRRLNVARWGDDLDLLIEDIERHTESR